MFTYTTDIVIKRSICLGRKVNWIQLSIITVVWGEVWGRHLTKNSILSQRHVFCINLKQKHFAITLIQSYGEVWRWRKCRWHDESWKLQIDIFHTYLEYFKKRVDSFQTFKNLCLNLLLSNLKFFFYIFSILFLSTIQFSSPLNNPLPIFENVYLGRIFNDLHSLTARDYRDLIVFSCFLWSFPKTAVKFRLKQYDSLHKWLPSAQDWAALVFR